MHKTFMMIALAALICLGGCRSKGDVLVKDGKAVYVSPAKKETARKLVKSLRRQEGACMVATLQALVRLGDAAIVACGEGINKRNKRTRLGCAWVLGRLGTWVEPK